MIRRDFLKILSLFGVTGTISYLLNTNQIQAGIQEIKGEVEDKIRSALDEYTADFS